MSDSALPITPELFRKAIEELDVELLHLEASRLYNSIFHLQKSNISLEEFPDDEECKQAIIENKEVIEHQEDRIRMITEEVERRGFKMDHDSTGAANGTTTTAESEAQGSGAAAATGSGTAAEATNGTIANGTVANGAQEEEEEEGVYL